MFIRLTNFHTGNHQYFNKNNIVTFGEVSKGHKEEGQTFVATVNEIDADGETYYVKETPQEIIDIIKHQEL